MQPTLQRLDAADTTLLLLVPDKTAVPAIVWLGETLPELSADHADAALLAGMVDLPLPMAKLDDPVLLSLFPVASSGIDCVPALTGHRDGKQFAQRFVCSKLTNTDNCITVELEDAAAGLVVIIKLTLHQTSGVLSVSTELHNCAEDDFQVDWLAAACVPLPGHFRECMQLQGRWGLEFQTRRLPLEQGTLTVQSNRGRSSHESYPGLMVGERGFSEQGGDVLGAVLAWSGNHCQTIHMAGDGRLVYQAGVAFEHAEMQLAAGQSLQAPVVHIKRSSTGLNGVSHGMHTRLRDHWLPDWTRQVRPVHANSWEALYFDHNTDTLKALIDAAAAVGAERFILDDGWFEGRRNDSAGLGDWVVDTAVYPQGLHPVVDHVRSMGMQFGLWFEPEMVNPDSDLYRAHPDWALHLTPYDTPLARNQLVLNIAKPVVFDYLYQHIAALVQEYRIDYIKWDNNRDYVLPGDGERACSAAQIKACYSLMQKLCEQFPMLEIETCASGGARLDWGILKHTGRVWTSDSIDAIDRVAIQRGYSYFHPPEIMGAHVGHAKAHLTGRVIDIHTRAIVALQGQFGFEVDARKLDSEEVSTLKYYSDMYKANREWVAGSRTWRLDSSEPALVCSGLVAQQQERSLWFVVACASLSSTTPGALVLQGLDPNRAYRVRLLSRNLALFESFCKKLPGWLHDEPVINGRLLMTVGLMLPVMPAQSALLLQVNAV